jgi:hypothetical protein
MSLEAIIQIAEESISEDAISEEIEEETEYVEKSLALSPAKKPKGRPMLHDIKGRTYFLRDEVTAAFKDPEAFAAQLREMHALSAERQQELITNKIEIGPAKTIDFTLHGPALTVMNLTNTILNLYPGHEHKIRLSKSKIVSPSNKLVYQKPTVAIENIKGKRVSKITFADM